MRIIIEGDPHEIRSLFNGSEQAPPREKVPVHEISAPTEPQTRITRRKLPASAAKEFVYRLTEYNNWSVDIPATLKKNGWNAETILEQEWPENSLEGRLKRSMMQQAHHQKVREERKRLAGE